MAIAVVASGSAILLGQQPRPTFRTGTRLVEIRAVVVDRDGKPVEGLTRDDFVLTENRVAQTISIFEVRDTRASVATADAETPRSIGTGYTNRPDTSSGVLAVILLDRVNAGFANQAFARDQVERFLRQMRNDDRIALYVLDGGISVLHDFTSDPISLRRSLDTYIARTRGEYQASIEPVPGPPAEGTIPVWIADPGLSMSEYFMERRTQDTFRSLRVLAEHLSGISGRKSVIWLSEAFPIPRRLGRGQFMQDLRTAARAFNDAHAALYPVDARGLVGSINFTSGRARFTTFGQVMDHLESMEVMAEETGGRVFAHSNALDASVRRALDENRLVYVLGYHPSGPDANDSYRSISLRVNKKGVTVRYRRGYVAAKPLHDRNERDQAVRAALQRPLTATQIGLAANVKYNARASVLTVDLQIDPSTVTLARDARGWTGDVDLLMASVAPNGRASIAQSATVRIEIPENQGLSPDAVPVTLTARLPPRTHQVRIAARDVASGQVGTLVIPTATLPR